MFGAMSMTNDRFAGSAQTPVQLEFARLVRRTGRLSRVPTLAPAGVDRCASHHWGGLLRPFQRKRSPDLQPNERSAVATLCLPNSYDGQHSDNSKSNQHGGNNPVVKARWIDAENFANKSQVRMVHDGSLGRYDLRDLRLCPTKERRLEDHVHGHSGDTQKHHFIQRNRQTCHVEKQVIDQLHLAWGSDKRMIHRDTLNLFKTRYKYVSNSISRLGSMMLGLFGKQRHYPFENKRIGLFWGVTFFGFVEKSRLISAKTTRYEVILC